MKNIFLNFPINILKIYITLTMLYLLLPERMKAEQVEKVVANLHDNNEYVIHIRNSKQALHHGLLLKKVHRIIKFNYKARLNPYIYMNAWLRKKSDSKKFFFKLINKAVFGKTMENVRKHRDIKLVTTEARRNYLVSEQTILQQIFFLKIYWQ